LPDRENTVIVLPVGAIAQHGPHLPCSVDSVISSGVLGKALEKLPAHVRASDMAPITYGKSDEYLHFPGTMTLTGPTLLATISDLFHMQRMVRDAVSWAYGYQQGHVQQTL